MNFYLGQICMFPWSWAPTGWLPCDGRLLQIAPNTSLFSLIGTEFGGDGKTSFAIPKLAALGAVGGGDVGYYICTNGLYPSRG